MDDRARKGRCMYESIYAIITYGTPASGLLRSCSTCDVILIVTMDPMYPAIESTQFPICDWSEFYGEVSEPIPPKAPKAIGKVVDVCMFVDSDHAGDQRT